MSSFKQILQAPNFWKSVLFIGLAFVLLYNAIDYAFGYSMNWDQFLEAKWQGSTKWRFIIANILGGALYGFIISFLRYRKQILQDKHKK